ncbi:hypothetical protein ACIGO8_08270 [Streptomyces sp. NPDC053493]|uniref:hypothetical protein n=1 Tax=Streptomyces sp. NPDC053493 TaxID=3365705 RepID=UPI0037D29D94
MSAARLTAARALLDQPPPAAVPGQIAIPDDALNIIRGTLTDHHLDHPDTQTDHIARQLTRHGWTITPAT